DVSRVARTATRSPRHVSAVRSVRHAAPVVVIPGLEFLEPGWTEAEVEGEPDRLRERVEQDRRDDHEWNADPFDERPWRARPGGDEPDAEAQDKRHLREDDVEHHAAEKVVLAFMAIEREIAARAVSLHVKP